jgi:hypothetical protein
VAIKVSSLKAITSFLSSIDDTEVVLKYQGIAQILLKVVIDVLKQDEEAGRTSLNTMIELTQAHGDLW